MDQFKVQKKSAFLSPQCQSNSLIQSLVNWKEKLGVSFSDCLVVLVNVVYIASAVWEELCFQKASSTDFRLGYVSHETGCCWGNKTNLHISQLKTQEDQLGLTISLHPVPLSLNFLLASHQPVSSVSAFFSAFRKVRQGCNYSVVTKDQNMEGPIWVLFASKGISLCWTVSLKLN